MDGNAQVMEALDRIEKKLERMDLQSDRSVAALAEVKSELALIRFDLSAIRKQVDTIANKTLAPAEVRELRSSGSTPTPQPQAAMAAKPDNK